MIYKIDKQLILESAVSDVKNMIKNNNLSRGGSKDDKGQYNSGQVTGEQVFQAMNQATNTDNKDNINVAERAHINIHMGISKDQALDAKEERRKMNTKGL